MKKLVKRIVSNLGYEKKKQKETQAFSPKYNTFNEIDYKVIEPSFFEIYDECKSETMTSVEKLHALYIAVNYIIDNDIAGDFVECGVWRGGSAMLIAKTLQRRNALNKKIYLYDTFNGMTQPTKEDVHIYSGMSAKDISERDYNGDNSLWCNANIEIVKKNMHKTLYPEKNIIFVEGKVEDTIPNTIPHKIALLRLDTDFYESSLHELIHLYPKLSKNGVILFDDYGFWEGQKIATDKYFSENKISLLMHRIDYAGRIAIKS